MRLSVVALLALIGCRSEVVAIVPEAPEQPKDAGVPVADAASDGAGEDAEVAVDAPVPAAKRKRYAVQPLTSGDNGLDGTFELWRDERMTEKIATEEFYNTSYALMREVPLAEWPVTAQLIVRDTHSRIVESLDLAEPMAKLMPVRLGDDAVPYFEVSIGTMGTAGRWQGTTHRFVRVEHGRSRWLDCAARLRGLGFGYDYDSRPSGGRDILSWHQEMDGGRSTLTRMEVVAGKCRETARVIAGWACEPTCPARATTLRGPPDRKAHRSGSTLRIVSL